MAKIYIKKDGSAIRRYKYEPYSESGSPFESWQEYQEWNETQPCINPACTKLRNGRAKYCPTCSQWATALGDPKYRPIKRSQYKEWKLKAMDMIQFNLSNPIVTDFCEKLTTIADHAKQGFKVEWGEWFAKIHNVLNHPYRLTKRSPEDYLAELAGVYCFYNETHNEWIRSERMWHYTLGSIMVRGTQYKLKPNPTGRRIRNFGKSVWGLFSTHFLPVAQATMRNEKLKRIREQKLAEAELMLPEEIERSE